MDKKTIKEEEDQKARERSQAYRTMYELWAFKDFMEMIQGIKASAIKSLYQVTDEKATANQFSRVRGILETVEKIEKELDYALNWREL